MSSLSYGTLSPHWVASASQAEGGLHGFSLVTVAGTSCYTGDSSSSREQSGPIAHPVVCSSEMFFIIIAEPKKPESWRLKTMWIHSSLVRNVRSLR